MNQPRVLLPGEVLPPLDSPGDSRAPVGSEPREPVALPARRSAVRVPPRSGRSGATKQRPPSDSRGRFKDINDFVDKTMRTLPDRAARAWFVLWRDTKPDGLARTSQSDLARRMGVSPDTAKRAIKDLKTAKLIDVVLPGSIARGPSVYRLKPTPGNPGR
ncbi:MAG: helix-turn-helix domain-containing protein [Planctomycetaceae bacterium]